MSNLLILLCNCFTVTHKGKDWRVSINGRYLVIENTSMTIRIEIQEHTGDLILKHCSVDLQTKTFGTKVYTILLKGLPSCSDDSFIPDVIDQCTKSIAEMLKDQMGALP